MDQQVIESYFARFTNLKEQRFCLIQRLNFIKEIESDLHDKLSSVEGESKDLMKLGVEETQKVTTDTSEQVRMVVAMAGTHRIYALKMIRLLLGVDLKQAKTLLDEAFSNQGQLE